jgi:AraC family transcriptional regulator, regulatory protein of adaptative response / DNA-3-methyladenine glycosylase II
MTSTTTSTRKKRATSSSADRALLDWLGLRAIPGVEQVDGSVYRRTARLGSGAGIIELHRDGARPAEAAPAARRVFGLDADHAAIDSALRADPLLAPLVMARPHLRIAGCFDGFELAVRAVLGQQVSVVAGRTHAARISAEHGEPLADPAPGLTHLFPAPEALAGVDLGGMPAARARAIRALAAAVAGGLVIEPGAPVRDSLLALPGIGPWTVEYVAMRALRDPDALPAGDLVLRKALGAISEADVRRRAEAWRPYRAYAAMHLWTAVAARP